VARAHQHHRSDIVKKAIAAFLLCASSAFIATAQTLDQLALVRFDPSPALSTRSIAMGGASDPDAPDAGLIATNPAFAPLLRKPSFLVSATRTHTAIDPDGRGAVIPLDRTTGFAASVAMPVSRSLSIGAYFVNEPRLRSPFPAIDTSSTTPYSPPSCEFGCDFLFGVFSPRFERVASRHGLVAGFRAGSLSAGIGIEAQRLQEIAEFHRSIFERSPPPLRDLVHERLFRRIDDTAYVPSAGIQWRPIPRLAVAAAYKGGADYERDTDVCGTDAFPWEDCVTEVMNLATSTQRMPDEYRASVAFEASSKTTLVAEVVRRNYSRSNEETYDLTGLPRQLNFTDATEYHVGAEHRFEYFALRGGWWRDPGRTRDYPVALSLTSDHLTFGIGVPVGPVLLEASYDDTDRPGSSRAILGLRFELR
jgi:hypothetical protein